MTAVRVAYLCSQYPWISHTFVQREVASLRALGASVVTFSIHRTRPEDLHSELDERTAASTRALLPTRPALLARAHWRAVKAAPAAYLALFRRALARFGGSGPREAALGAAYVGEAMLLWDAMRAEGLRHVHVHFANPAADVAMAAVTFGEAVDGPGTWTWSFTMHGPAEFYNVAANRLRPKVESALFVACISEFARSQLMGQVGVEHWEKLHIVRCGVDPATFRSSDEHDA